MTIYVNRGLRIAIFLFALLHFVNYFINIRIIVDIQAFVGLVMLILAGTYFKPNRFKLPLFLLILGVIILLGTDRFNYESIQNGLLQMSDVVGLLVIVPIVSWVLRQEPYIEEMIGLAHKLLNTSHKFYILTISFANILTSFLLFGVISLMYQIISKILRHQSGEAWEYFKSTAILRGYSLSSLWIISLPGLAYAVETLNAPLWKTVMQGFLVAVAAIIMASLFHHFEKKRYQVDFTSEIQKEIGSVLEKSFNKKEQIKKTMEFIFLFITLFGAIFLFYELLNVKLMLLIPFIIVAWVSLYFLIKRRPKNMLAEMKNYYKNELAPQGYLLSVITSAGVIIFALNQSGVGEAMINEIYLFQEKLPFFNMLYFFPLIIIILSFIGLEPMVSMILVAGLLKSIDLSYSPELIVLALTSGGAISVLLSPLMISNIILSDINGLNPIKNGFKFNYKYAITLYVMVQVYIQMKVW